MFRFCARLSGHFRATGRNRVVLLLTTLGAVAVIASAGTISGNVADYNAAQVVTASGVLTVPAGLATYTANSTVTIGSSFTVTLPAGFTFGSAPTLTTSGTSTFTLASGGLGSQSATFTVATADLTATQTISLDSFVVHGATSLGTVTPVASALPVTMQVAGTDPSPLAFKAFASDVGAMAVFVGAIQFIDTTPPSNGTKFNSGQTTIVLSAIAISPQTTDAATNAVAILSPNGSPNTLSNTDTATVKMNFNTGGLTKVFSSTTSNCNTPIQQGTVNFGNLTVPNVALNTEVFFCVTAGGGVLSDNPNGITTVTVTHGTSTDFISAPVNNEFPGLVCYSNGAFGCIVWTPPQSAVPTPTLSEWGMISLAGMIVLLGAWKLKRPTFPTS